MPNFEWPTGLKKDTEHCCIRYELLRDTDGLGIFVIARDDLLNTIAGAQMIPDIGVKILLELARRDVVEHNNGNGKDHWSIGSIMLLGRGIQGNRVLGATDERQFHVPLNPRTLATDRQNGIRVRPERIHTALREFAGIADHAFSRRFPLGVADNERLRGLCG